MVEWIPLKALEHYCLEIFFLFEDRLPKEDFIQRINLLGEKKANEFYRACLSYIMAQKCLSCEPDESTSVALCLLCTSIETLSENPSKYPFHDWLIKYKLDDLVNKSKNELKKKIQFSYLEYLEHPQRTGKSHDFTCFLLDYCPQNLRTAPIKSSLTMEQGISQLRAVPFEDSIKYIYSIFRSPYIHESRKKIDIPNKLSKLKEIYLFEFYKKKFYHTDLKKLPIWFSKVVKESFYEYLIKNT